MGPGSPTQRRWGHAGLGCEPQCRPCQAPACPEGPLLSSHTGTFHLRDLRPQRTWPDHMCPSAWRLLPPRQAPLHRGQPETGPSAWALPTRQHMPAMSPGPAASSSALSSSTMPLCPIRDVWPHHPNALQVFPVPLPGHPTECPSCGSRELPEVLGITVNTAGPTPPFPVKPQRSLLGLPPPGSPPCLIRMSGPKRVFSGPVRTRAVLPGSLWPMVLSTEPEREGR